MQIDGKGYETRFQKYLYFFCTSSTFVTFVKSVTSVRVGMVYMYR